MLPRLDRDAIVGVKYMFSSDVLLSSMDVSRILILIFDPDFKQKWNENTQCWNARKNMMCTNFGLGTKFKLELIPALREWLNINKTWNTNDFLIQM
jgi:hypothetical protein